MAKEKEKLPKLPLISVFHLLRIWSVRLESQKGMETLFIGAEVLHTQDLLYTLHCQVQDENALCSKIIINHFGMMTAEY